MKRTLLLALATITSAGLITAGIVKAQSTGVDQPLSTIATTAVIADTSTTTTPNPQTLQPHKGHHLQEMADLLGMSVSDLQTQLANGTPFYKIAASKGITFTKLVEKKQAEAEAKINDMVASGFLTKGQGDQFLQKMKDQIASNPTPMMGHHGFGVPF